MTTHVESFYWGICVGYLVQTQRLGPWLSLASWGEPGSFFVIADDPLSARIVLLGACVRDQQLQR